MNAFGVIPATPDVRKAASDDAKAGVHGGTILLALAGITLIGAILRLYGLLAQSLWLDEISSLRNARAFGSGGLAALAAVDQVAPLHSIVLWLSTEALGATALASRLPSAIGGILTIPLIYLVAIRALRSPKVGLVAAALVAVSPFAIYYSQEGRMYALLLTMATAWVAVAWPVVERPLRPAELALLVLVTTMGLGMHHYMALLSAAFGLFLLVRGLAFAPRAWAWLGAQIVAMAIFSYWMVLTADRMAGAAGNAKPAILLWTPYSFYSFVVGFSFGPAIDELAGAGDGAVGAVMRYLPAVALVAVATAILALIGLRRALRPDWRPAGQWLVIWLFVPIALAILATFVTNIQFNVRYVIVSFPALVLLLAIAICDIRWGRARALLTGQSARGHAIGSPRERGIQLASMATVGVLATCMAIALVNLYANPAYAKADVRTLAGYLKQRPADVVLIGDNNRVSKVLGFYGTTGPSDRMAVDYRFPTHSPEAVWRNVEAARLTPGRPVWLIEYRSWEADPDAYLRRHLDATARLTGTARWPGVIVRRYVMPPIAATAARGRKNVRNRNG